MLIFISAVLLADSTVWLYYMISCRACIIRTLHRSRITRADKHAHGRVWRHFRLASALYSVLEKKACPIMRFNAKSRASLPDQSDRMSSQMMASGGETTASSDSSEGEEEQTWISWFCRLKGNEFYCEVDEDFIQDDFNLSGLSSTVPYFDYALDVILDVETRDPLSEQQHELIESAAEMLYGLIHARYILTGRGMLAMLEKYKQGHFGRCPRSLCNNQMCLPTGNSDVFRTATVKIFCPRCQVRYWIDDVRHQE